MEKRLQGEALLAMDERRFLVNGFEVCAAFAEADRDNVFIPLLRRLTALQRELGRRIAVFLAAPPAAGKSTLCCYLEALSREMEFLTPVQCVGIDGFHYHQSYLDSHSICLHGEVKPLACIKGAPETYDVEKLRRLLAQLNQPEQLWPLYDRRIHNPVENAVELRENILIVEGNWLLLDEAPWNELTCDYSIFLACGDESQLERIVQRKMQGGFSEAHARAFVRSNDWPNIQRCMHCSRRGSLNLARGEDGLLKEI